MYATSRLGPLHYYARHLIRQLCVRQLSWAHGGQNKQGDEDHQG